MDTASNQRAGGWGALLRLWIILAFSFAVLKLLIDLVYPGYIDLRSSALLQFVAIPTGQALVYWVVARRGRRA